MTVLKKLARRKTASEAVGSRFVMLSDSTRDYLKMVTAGWGTKYEIMGHHLNVSDSLRRRIITEVPPDFRNR